MLMRAVQFYLEVRRSVGFELHNTERRLRDFAHFAGERGDTKVRAGVGSRVVS